MGYFRDSADDVQKCIDALVAAQAYHDPELRSATVNEALSLVARLRVGNKLEPTVRKLVEADNLTKAILLLRAYQQNRGFNVAPIAIVILPLVALFFFLVVPRLADEHDAALKVIDDCPAAVELLGDDLEIPLWGLIAGGSQSNSGMTFADWSMPVRGNGAQGTLSYLAYRHAGPWDVYHAHLSVDDEHFLVVPCWGKVSEPDAEGRLQKGYSGEGTVSAVEGKAPVKAGDACAVTVAVEPDYPGDIPFNCKITVSCDNRALYGGTERGGYAFCHARDGRPVSAFDNGGSDSTGDPILQLDLDKHQLRMKDDGASGSYGFTIKDL